MPRSQVAACTFVILAASVALVATPLGPARVERSGSPVTAQAPGPVNTPGSTQSLVDLALSVRERVRLEAQVRRARARLEILKLESEALASQRSSVLGELRQHELERQRYAAEEEAAVAAGTLARASLSEVGQNLETLEATVAEREPLVRARLRRLYALGPLDAPRHWLRASGLAQIARAWRLLAAVGARDREVLTQAARDREALEYLRGEQQTRATEADELARAAGEARQAAARALAASQALLSRLTSERDLSAQLVEELQRAEEQLSELLAAPPAAGPASDKQPAALLPLAPFKGDLDWPVKGPVLTRFGREREGRFGTVLPRNGVEIGAEESTAVRTPHEGSVVFADAFAGLGRLVIVEHEAATFSLYGHLGEVVVSRGDQVVRGTALGSVGRTPSGQTALYFELRIDGRPVDPLEWVRPTP